MAGEDVLAGGDMTAVVRAGDTVRRTAGPGSPQQAVLARGDVLIHRRDIAHVELLAEARDAEGAG